MNGPGFHAPAGCVAHVADLGGDTFAILEWPLARRRPPMPMAQAEREVLELLLLGASNADIASRRRRSVRTIAHQVESIFRRLGVRSRLELFALWSRGGQAQHSGVAEPARIGASPEAAMRSLGRVRGHLRRTDPDEARAIWRALFEGLWSMMRCTESDGRRFLFVRRNGMGTCGPRSLTRGEGDVLARVALGHSNKYVGYHLGVATSTVSSRLGSALRKLGLASRRDAIELFGALAAPAGYRGQSQPKTPAMARP